MAQSLPEHLRDLARRVAQHEFGHYVVARALGFQTGDVSIELTGPIAGNRGQAAVTLQTPTGSLDLAVDYLSRRVIVLYSGAVAEALPRYGSPSKSVDIDSAIEIIRNPALGAEQDHAKARELIQVLRNIKHSDTDPEDGGRTQSELDKLDEQLFGRAVELVEAHVDTILGLAGNLSVRVIEMKVPFVITAAELESLPSVQKIVVVPTFPG